MASNPRFHSGVHFKIEIQGHHVLNNTNVTG